jgi:hypothetical protein
MPTRQGHLETHGEGDLHHWTLAPPAAQMHHRGTRQSVKLVHRLDTHADPGVTHGSQKEFSAVIMGTLGCLTAPTGHFVELMQK